MTEAQYDRLLAAATAFVDWFYWDPQQNVWRARVRTDRTMEYNNAYAELSAAIHGDDE